MTIPSLRYRRQHLCKLAWLFKQSYVSSGTGFQTVIMGWDVLNYFNSAFNIPVVSDENFRQCAVILFH